MALEHPFLIFSTTHVTNSESTASFRGEWTKLILTQHWPQTFCSVEKCTTNLSFWTLHGLWPNTGMRCNTSWHFNASLIEIWEHLPPPNFGMFKNLKYEWTKHGTCAAKAESLNSQHKYFILVFSTITSFYNVKTKIQCVHPGKGGQVQILGQIEICVDRDFQLIDCEKSTEEIWSNDIPAVAVSGQ
uniref:Ribonuclease T2 n=1 Tax=Sinocyclocheilus grahami TaxID=75366 RepID=A0A672NGS5_SINGR